MAEKYEQHPNLSKKQILEEVNYISCDLLLNVISEFNTLAFFYPYPGNILKGFFFFFFFFFFFSFFFFFFFFFYLFTSFSFLSLYIYNKSCMIN